MENVNSQDKKRNDKLAIIIAVSAIVVVAILALILVILFTPACNEKRQSSVIGGSLISFDDSAQSGNLPGKTAEELQEELNRIVEEGMFNIAIASVIVFPTGDSYGAARIENIAANHYHMQVTITFDGNNEVLYESAGIKPGQYIEKIKLLHDLEPGQYSATATFRAFNQQDMTEAGKAAAKITIWVEG